MIRTIITPTLSSSSMQGGLSKLVMDRPQMVELYEYLTEALHIDLDDANVYFLEKNGYLGTDRAALTYWAEHHD